MPVIKWLSSLFLCIQSGIPEQQWCQTQLKDRSFLFFHVSQVDNKNIPYCTITFNTKHHLKSFAPGCCSTRTALAMKASWALCLLYYPGWTQTHNSLSSSPSRVLDSRYVPPGLTPLYIFDNTRPNSSCVFSIS